MRLLFVMGADAGGEAKGLAAETGVLGRGGWGTFCMLVLTLEYVASSLFWLNTPLAD